ncbi:MAG: 3' terminal RNA ribose 2'-O-methyltransferase Hen1 [Clostridiales bacterium]|jgi:3' terminal RNA ribose 2'-O-methyltransferase Hen1|nr:3' terminal RNA ribose 2'-O-methyltransferase Hen1 [Clostridiales bacterium]
MILTITYKGENTQNIGFLLHKNPARPQVVALNHGKAYVFYPEVSDEKTTVALVLDIDPIDLARGKAGSAGGGLFDYVNDRPYVSSSFMSTAINRVFGTAMTGRGDDFQALADAKLDLTATITMLPCKSDNEMLNRVFEPLGYEVRFEQFVSDEKFPAWGESKCVNLTIHGVQKLSDLLHHIYVLIPVFDRNKHYWIGKEEVEKLLRHSEDWLKDHPEKAFITGRYLNRSRSLLNMAFERLRTADEASETEEKAAVQIENRPNLNKQRLDSVITAVKACEAKTVIDIGCGEGNLLALLMKEPTIRKISAADVSFSVLEKAKAKIKFDRLSDTLRDKVNLFQGSLTYRDKRFTGYDAACVIEVIEHLDLSRLNAFERVLFEYARPKTVILTTPNKEYNQNYQNLAADRLRHGDHRFEWTRQEFKDWANRISEKFGYAVAFSEIGDIDENCGSPTQMGVFSLCE